MNYWLAQANPTKFLIIEYYAKYGNPDTQNTWHSRYAGKVRTDDKVFCFKSKGDNTWRAILSLEEVTCNATKGLKLLPQEEEFVIDRKAQDRLSKEWGFTTRTVKAFPYNPIKEEDFKKYPGLRDLNAPTPLRRGIFHLSRIQWESLEDLIRRTRCV
jgi:hypothetical protein